MAMNTFSLVVHFFDLQSGKFVLNLISIEAFIPWTQEYQASYCNIALFNHFFVLLVNSFFLTTCNLTTIFE